MRTGGGGARLWALLGAAAALASGAAALSCWQCGEYNDGVGSITPCLNTSTLHLVACSPPSDNYCIKYVNELSTVRDCVPSCSERESWGARTYCCKSDGCNGSMVTVMPARGVLLLAAVTASAASTILQLRRPA